MKLAEAIGLCEKGKMVTSDVLPNGAVLHCDETGELRVKYLATGDGYTFTPRAEHHAADWRERQEGWGSYD